MKILVIEDNKDILEVLNLILIDDGYDVVSCADGSAINNLKNIKPALILMDELLPSVKGSELCLRIKSDDEFKHIPVILVSASQGLEHIAAKCGADAYIEKPFDIERLTGLVKSLI
ncbi:response regulator [Mucilaginibacter agri]|uniref:Response regulator n=1 Tax=Mucilaginibacter agri TaxID=2695265 RepID=A0A966DUU4_9SPHI|nr:response regulator [Mucilaginibacter agri]NCD70792.1 response regulator [Mucilaginibacter agri]